MIKKTKYQHHAMHTIQTAQTTPDIQVWYGILEFNVPLDVQYKSFWRHTGLPSKTSSDC